MGWTVGVLVFDSRWGLGIFLFTTAVFRTALGPTQSPIQRVAGSLSLVIKRPGREADHSPPSRAEVKNAWSYTSTPQYAFMAWCLVKQVHFRMLENIWEVNSRSAGNKVVFCFVLFRKFPSWSENGHEESHFSSTHNRTRISRVRARPIAAVLTRSTRN
jgi:hypothetical protein